MKLRRSLFALFITLFIGFSSLRAQTNFVVQFISNDTTAYYFNDTIRSLVTLSMNGPGLYQGQLKFGYRVPTGNNIPDTLELQNQNSNLVLQGGQTLTYELDIPVSTASFGSGGGHTVIVWPILTPLPANSTVDSLYFSTEVLGWLSLSDVGQLSSLQVFPVPAEHTLMLQNPEAVSLHISLMDLSGKVLSEIKTAQEITLIPVQTLSPGMYLLRCVQSDGKSRVFSWIKK
ncbi:MAG: T9SS type A sorting domain-containing protein [Flavobacteriales bacterium]|nr:T9SS type A sorting domain-containing protein [Flavobacteriales bacterium]